MNIWQIQQKLLSIFDELEENGGELTEELEQQLAISQENFKSKIKDYIDVVKSITADIAAIDLETKRLTALKKNKTSTVTRLNKIIIDAVDKFGETTKTGTKFFDYGTGKVSIRNSEKVEVDFDRTDNIAKQVINYFNELAYTKEIDNITTLDEQEVREAIKNTEGGLDFTADEFYNIPATISLDINLKDLLSYNGISFMQRFFNIANAYNIKSNISKTTIKNTLKNGNFNLENIAHIESNKTLTIK